MTLNYLLFLLRNSIAVRVVLLISFILVITNTSFAQQTYIDNFNTVSYSNNNGTQFFSTDWTESDNSSASTGYISISGGRLYFYEIWAENIVRSLDLSIFSTATLSFNWEAVSLETGEALAVQISNDGGANYVSLASFTGTQTGNFSQDISAYISKQTVIRFAKSGNNWSDTGDKFYIDNFTITAQGSCGKTFTDSGGATGNYANNEDKIYKICSDISGKIIGLNFTAFNIENNYDYMYIYDGDSTSSPLIGTYTGTASPGTIMSSSTSGCLTVRFISDANTNTSGWSADIICTEALLISGTTVNEDEGNAVVTVKFNGSKSPFSVNYTTADGTAIAGTDYTSTSGILNFSGVDAETQTITIPIIDDALFQGTDINFQVNLSNISDSSITVINNPGTVNIVDNDLVEEVPLTLTEEFNGYFDYTMTGGTFRTASNTVNSCSITTTSSATGFTSTISPTAVIKKAFLYWSHSSTTLDTQVTFEGQAVDAEMAYHAVLNSAGNILNFYGYRADVTSIIKSISNPSTNVYDITDLTIDNTDTNNPYCSTSTVLGGWSLIVFYEDEGLPAVTINLYQGFDGLSNESTSFTLDGFYAIGGAGSKATFLSWEGDSTLDGNSGGTTNPNGESLSITNQGGTKFVLTGDGGQTGNNAYNSTIYDNTAVPVFNTTTSYGVDIDTYNISSHIATSDTEVTANVDAGQDFIISNVVIIKVPSNIITGVVFEDVNYGGGVGRSLLDASGQLIEGVKLELYDGSGLFLKNTTTNVNGEYTFGGMANGTYNIRIVNNTVSSTRVGGDVCTTCIPVQTYRRNYASSVFSDIINEVGGANPNTQDVATGILTGAQTKSSVSILNEGVVGLNFGFNFNTIVNTNASGQGSLAQFIENTNKLGNSGINIEANSIFDPAAGEDTSVFMIPSIADPLGRTADVNYASGIFTINQTSTLPDILDAATHIDGRTQTAYSGDTNTGTIGSGGATVGISAITLPTYQLPEIQVHGVGGDVLKVGAENTVIRNMAVYSDSNAGIQVNSGSALITNNLIGVNATGINGEGIAIGAELLGGTTTLDGNYIATNTEAGIIVNGGNTVNIQNNHFTTNGDACGDNITVINNSGLTVQQNLIENSGASGIDALSGINNALIKENTITTAGQNGGVCIDNIEAVGLRMSGINNTVSKNIIYSNGGAGVVITGTSSSGNLITQNSIYANGTNTPSLGIDIDNSTATNPIGDGVTLNDDADIDTGANTLLNFPVFSSITSNGVNLKIKGWSRPGAVIEFFISDISEGTAVEGDNQLGLTQDYGEGQTYLGTFIEGSASDTGVGTSAYVDADGNTDTTNEFEFIIPLPQGVDIDVKLTATTTVDNNTSEFSANRVVNIQTVITNRKITYRIIKN